MSIGVLGGGQLGRMLALAGLPAGPRASSSSIPRREARARARRATSSRRPTTARALDELASRVDVVTYEFENVPVAAARALAARVPVYPAAGGARGVAGSAGREDALPRARHPDAPLRRRSTRAPTLEAALDAHRAAGVLKTRRLGYDGKGQLVLRARRRTSARRGPRSAARRCILEAFVPFTRELSLPRACAAATARRRSTRWSRTTIATASCAARWRRRPVLTPALHAEADGAGAPAGRAPRLRRRARARAVRGRRRAARQRDGAARAQLRPLDDRGRRDEPVREPRARDHRAAAGLDDAVGVSAMVNLIGGRPAPRRSWRAGAHLHLYGKAPRPGARSATSPCGPTIPPSSPSASQPSSG